MEARVIYNRSAACFVQPDGTVVVYCKRIGTPPLVGGFVRLSNPPKGDGPLFDAFEGALSVRGMEYVNFAQLPEEAKEDVITLLRGMAPQPYAPYVKYTLST